VPDDLVLTPLEVARLLRVSDVTVRRMITRGYLPRIPGVRVVLIPRSAVDCLLLGEYDVASDGSRAAGRGAGMIGAIWIEIASAIHLRTCKPWAGRRIRGVAYPFGVPDAMPPHRWRASWDVMQALTEAAPPPIGDNPKGSEGATKLLFGWPIDVDRDASPGTLALEPLPGSLLASR
jgi:excisionase family DNA binding protein